MDTKLTEMVDGVWPCLRCEVKTKTLRLLRSHVSRNHRGTSMRTKVSSQATLRPLYLKKFRERVKASKKIQSVQRKKKFGYVAAYTRGSFRCSSPLIVVKPSTIPGAGFGVFAAVELLPGDIVTWYS
ncbi:unnamed protein product, partial [Aphanomyces euteiches]